MNITSFVSLVGQVIAFCIASSIARVFSSERIYFETDFPDEPQLRPQPPPQQVPFASSANRFPTSDLPPCTTIAPSPPMKPMPPLMPPMMPVPEDEVHYPAGRIERATARLSLNLATNFHEGREVFVFSPISIVGALSMLYAGATGRTEEEIAAFMNVQPGRDGYDEISHHLMKVGTAPVGGTLRFANGIFFQKGTQVSKEYLSKLEQNFPVSIEEIDFTFPESGYVMNVINRWVSNRTEGVITEIISQPPPPDTAAILLNVIFFEGEWEFPFTNALVKWGNFYVSPTETVQVELMPQLAPAYLHEDKKKGVKVLGLPYKNSDVAMYFILPTKTTLDTFLTGVDEDDLFAMIDKATRQEVIYTVPKMKLETTVELRDSLSKMGLESLFSSSPDLRNIAETIRVDSVLQKVEVQITETGTKAAATTMVSTTRSGRPLVRLDRPFAFLLYHAKMKVIYFWGTVHKPTPHSNHSRSNLLQRLRKSKKN